MSVLRTAAPVVLGATLILGTGLFPQSAAARAQTQVSLDRAPVVAAEPVYRTVSYSVPAEECRLVETPVSAYSEPGYGESGYRSYTAPILGAIIGGAIGNAVGHSNKNKKVGTAVGAVLGGTIGRDIGRRAEQNRHQSQQVRWETREVCETFYATEERQELDGYEVTYRYAGQLHQTRMDHDPGRYLQVRVQVTPV